MILAVTYAELVSKAIGNQVESQRSMISDKRQFLASVLQIINKDIARIELQHKAMQAMFTVHTG